MTTLQIRPFIHLVKPDHYLPANNTDTTPGVGYGRVWGWRNSADAPLIIQLDNGIHIACGGITPLQRESAMAADCIGMQVGFWYAGIDRRGAPVNPRFKTLLLTQQRVDCEPFGSQPLPSSQAGHFSPSPNEEFHHV